MGPEDLLIDIETDSVDNILHKWFYQASGGKLIDCAWEPNFERRIEEQARILEAQMRPRPKVRQVRRIRRPKGSLAENINAAQNRSAPADGQGDEVGAEAELMGSINNDVTRVAEVPIRRAKAFATHDPIGPFGKAIKAAGTLSALAEKQGDEGKNVWKILEGTWGPIPEKVKINAKPDLTDLSREDEIKLVRPSASSLDESALLYYNPRYEADFVSNDKEAATPPDLVKYTQKTFRECTTGVATVATRTEPASTELTSAMQAVHLEPGVDTSDN
eukprot:scaffold6929_cov99-Cylindrotheca_fusiformis.AAC.5